jgi:quercetin dioxygenase-like cupin family protein
MDNMAVKHAQDVEAQVVMAGDKTTIQVLISSQEGPNFALRRFVMEPGGGMPNHTNTVEHEQYVLQGHANVGIGDKVFEVKAGDVVFIPEGVPHWYQNLGELNFEFLCIIPNKPDEIKIVDKEC